jgi:hypothetical protein
MRQGSPFSSMLRVNPFGFQDFMLDMKSAWICQSRTVSPSDADAIGRQPNSESRESL